MDEPQVPPTRTGFKQYLPDVFLLLVLLLLTIKFGYDINTVRDVMTDDETNYLAHGHFLKQWGLPDACYSPLYVLWYNAWDHLQLDPLFVYYANWGLLTYLLAAGQYVLIRTLGGFRIAALAFAFLALTSGVGEIWPYPMHLATFALAISAAIAGRLRSWTGSLLTIGTALAVAAYLRPEFSISFLLYCPVALGSGVWVAWKRPELRWRLALAFVLLAALGAGLLTTFGNPLGGGRSFFAFGQHYSLNKWSQHQIEADPWTNWETIVHGDFGDAQSIPQALRNNPRAVAWHLSCNLSYLPAHVKFIITSRLGLGVRATEWLFRGLCLFVAVGLIGLLLRLFRPSLAGDPANRSLRIVLFMLLFVAAPTLASLVIIFPRMHYLLPLVTFGGALGFAGYCGFPRVVARLRWLECWQAVAAFVALLALGTPNAVHSWSVQQWVRGPQPATAPALDVQRTVAVMRGLDVHSDKPIGVLESDFSRAFFARWDFFKVDHWAKKEGFWQFLANHHISVVVLNDRLRSDARFRDDPEFVAFTEEKKAGPFVFFAVPGTTVRLAVRKEVLPHTAPRYAVALGFLQNNEYQANFIIKKYEHYLGRTPSRSEVAGWLQAEQGPCTAARVRAGILGSDEYYARSGSSDKSWVDAVYLELVGHPADATEESPWLQQLASGVSRADIVLRLATNPEGMSRLVQSYYQQYLGRTGSAVEITAWVNDLQPGSTDEEILACLLSSPDFYEHAGNTDQEWLDTLCRQLFNRPALPGEENDGLRKLAAGQ